jgi:hypothetical protein
MTTDALVLGLMLAISATLGRAWTFGLLSLLLA